MRLLFQRHKCGLALLFLLGVVANSPAQKSILSPKVSLTERFPKQTVQQNEVRVQKDTTKSQKTMVYLENSETLSFDQERLPGVQLLKGDVCFRHDNAFLYCDSAYFYEEQNSFNAYGHVKIVQGDTLFVYGDVLYYDGNTKMARLRHNVKMENRRVTLTTDSLNYDRLNNVGYYFQGGKLQDELNVLTSVYGYYYPNTNDAVFNDAVVLTNPKFVLNSDTLNYNTKTEIASILDLQLLFIRKKLPFTRRKVGTIRALKNRNCSTFRISIMLVANILREKSFFTTKRTVEEKRFPILLWKTLRDK
jgi:lipopolysaccharide assembly outer membrane protein LptD (OstA)